MNIRYIIRQVFEAIAALPRHTFQILTKRPQRIPDGLPWPDNLWLGVSVETQAEAWRAWVLCCFPAFVRFVSAEPLLGPVSALPLDQLHWVIAGGETGPRARAMELDWVRGLRDECISARVPFFFKGFGGRDRLRVLDGRTWEEFPR